MKITGRVLHDLQWDNHQPQFQYKWRSNSVKKFWEDYAERVNAALSIDLTNQDEQTDDSSGVPSHSSGIFAASSEGELK